MSVIEDIMEGNMSLSDTESYMRSVEEGMKLSLKALAISLGAIKKHQLYLSVAKSFQEYIELERTYISKSQADRLARIGENYLRYRKQLEDHDIKLNGNSEKVRIIDPQLVDRDPMYWLRLRSLSFRQFRDYQEEKRHAYIDVYHSEDGEIPVSVKGAGLYIGDKKVKGLNLNDAKHEIAKGKRAFVVWIDDDDATYKRAKRAIEKAAVEED